MDYNFFIIGGDKRMFYLAKKLSKDENNVKALGLEKIGYENLLNNNIKIAQSIDEIEENDILIGGIPTTKDNIFFYTPLSDKKIYLKDIKNKKIIGGNIPSGINGIDLLKDESFSILNAIPTAEGAIAKVIQETESTIMDSNVLVLGFGRIGKIICNKLKSMGANVYCTARKKEDFAWMRAYGYNGIEYNELNKKLCRINIIINTVPKLILDKNRLVLLRENVLILDLVSDPGGIDKKAIEQLGINAIQYLGIPGKTAPEKTGEYISESIYGILKSKQS